MINIHKNELYFVFLGKRKSFDDRLRLKGEVCYVSITSVNPLNAMADLRHHVIMNCTNLGTVVWLYVLLPLRYIVIIWQMFITFNALLYICESLNKIMQIFPTLAHPTPC